MTGVAPLFVGGAREPPPPTSNCQHDHGLHHFHAVDVGEKEKTGRLERYAKGGRDYTCVKSKISDEIFSSLPFLLNGRHPCDPPCPTIGRTWHSLNIRPCSIKPDGVIAFGFF